MERLLIFINLFLQVSFIVDTNEVIMNFVLCKKKMSSKERTNLTYHKYVLYQGKNYLKEQ